MPKTIVYIQWFDASYQRGECTLDELVTRVVLHSAGWLVQEDDDSYYAGRLRFLRCVA